jgi:AcrR family transcriptional regulator
MSRLDSKTIRNPVETRLNILEVAFNEIYRHGFKGTSTNTIIEKMEMTRGAFFHHFPTKDDLGHAIIDELLKNMILERWIQPVAAYDDPVAGILNNFARLIDEHLDDHLLCGCPLNNLVQEMADRPAFQKRIQAIMEMWIEETQSLLTQAKRSGQLKKEINTRKLAEFIVACQEASFSMGKALNSREAMHSVQKSLKEYVNFLR